VSWLISSLITGVIAFAATNLDDILFLTIFFSESAKKWQVVVGQYSGFTALVLLSLVGFFGGRVLPHEWIRWLGVLPIVLGLKKLFRDRDQDRSSGSSTVSVAAVTFVNGADNIGIYSALFAVSDAARVIVLISVLYVLLAAWCLIAYRVHSQQAIAQTLKKYGHRIVPFILIGLGIYIFVA